MTLDSMIRWTDSILINFGLGGFALCLVYGLLHSALGGLIAVAARFHNAELIVDYEPLDSWVVYGRHPQTHWVVYYTGPGHRRCHISRWWKNAEHLTCEEATIAADRMRLAGYAEVRAQRVDEV